MPPPNEQAAALLPLAVSILESWEKSDASLDDLLDQIPHHVPQRVRAGVTSVLFAYFRNRTAIEAFLRDTPYKIKPRFARIIQIALAQIFFQSALPDFAVVKMAVDYAKKRFGPTPGNLINKILRDCATQQNRMPAPTLPENVMRAWSCLIPQEAIQEIIQVFPQTPPFTFRSINQFSISAGLNITPISDTFLPPNLFYTPHTPGDILGSELFHNGHIYIQDPATFFVIHNISKTIQHPITKIHDVCAAPGGKALMLAEFLKPEQIRLSDRSEKRQKLTRQNLTRCAHLLPKTHFEISVADATHPVNDFFDLVFLDVPCSNTGVFRHRPDALYRYTPEKIDELKALQFEIIDQQSRTVAPHGYLVYSTCSIEPSENQEQAERFLATHPNFKILTQETLYPSALHDGAFCAIFQRKD